MPEYDYYEILEVHPKASKEVIDNAFRTLAKRYHPDAGGHTKIMQMLNEAYAVLSDPKARAEYDRSRNLTAETQADVGPLSFELPNSMLLWRKRLSVVPPRPPRGRFWYQEYAMPPAYPGPVHVAVDYLANHLHQVPLDLFAYTSVLAECGLETKEHEWLRESLKHMADVGVRRGSALLESDAGTTLVPLRAEEGTLTLDVWFSEGDPPTLCSSSGELPPFSLARSLLAWLEHLKSVLDAGQLTWLESEISELHSALEASRPLPPVPFT